MEYLTLKLMYILFNGDKIHEDYLKKKSKKNTSPFKIFDDIIRSNHTLNSMSSTLQWLKTAFKSLHNDELTLL